MCPAVLTNNNFRYLECFFLILRIFIPYQSSCWSNSIHCEWLSETYGLVEILRSFRFVSPVISFVTLNVWPIWKLIIAYKQKEAERGAAISSLPASRRLFRHFYCLPDPAPCWSSGERTHIMATPHIDSPGISSICLRPSLVISSAQNFGSCIPIKLVQ